MEKNGMLWTPKKLYVGGPIVGTHYDASTSWREEVRQAMPEGIVVISPMRAKEHLAGGNVTLDRLVGHAVTSNSGVVSRDRFDVASCDAILVNLLGATKVSLGSSVELGWADMLRKPVIVVMEAEGNPHDHPMLRGLADFLVPTLEEGIQAAIHVLVQW